MEENIDNTKEGIRKKVKGQIIGSIICAIGLFYLLAPIYYKQHILKVQGKITKGFVYTIQLTRGASLVYRFTTNDTVYTGASNVDTKSSAVEGDSITIVYDPEDPDNSDPACDILDSFADIK